MDNLSAKGTSNKHSHLGWYKEDLSTKNKMIAAKVSFVRRFHCTSAGFATTQCFIWTDDIPDGCSENPYHKIAVTILACFCTDEKLVWCVTYNKEACKVSEP